MQQTCSKAEWGSESMVQSAGGTINKELKAIPDMELDEFLDGGFQAAGLEAEAVDSEDDSSSMDGDLALEAGDAPALEPNVEMPDAQAAGSEGLSICAMFLPALQGLVPGVKNLQACM